MMFSKDSKDQLKQFMERFNKRYQERFSAALEDEYKDSKHHMHFAITDFELKSLLEWTRQHNCFKQNYTYCFTPTGIGTAITVQCDCGEEKNITDMRVGKREN